MKNFIIIFASLLSFASNADDIILLPKVNFEIESKNALSKIKDVLLIPENIIKRYEPTGATISKKSVDKNQFQFNATKSVLFISKTVFVHSYFEIEESSSCSSQKEIGYMAKMDFSGSDAFLTDNIEKYEAIICFQEKSSSNLAVTVMAKIYKGNFYSSVVGPIMRDMIAAQTQPLIRAITEEVKSH